MGCNTGEAYSDADLQQPVSSIIVLEPDLLEATLTLYDWRSIECPT